MLKGSSEEAFVLFPFLQRYVLASYKNRIKKDRFFLELHIRSNIFETKRNKHWFKDAVALGNIAQGVTI